MRWKNMLAIRLPDEIENRLDNLARRTGRTKTFYAREAILMHLEDLEDYYLVANTVARVRKGQDTVHSSEEVRKSLGLED
ncbi:type II toxin-antitoxin system RelB family antitoxin [Candidatus Williamhamiltonella defendens]|uniref:type II toxin-antitoxin system RelB family antitoxin n=1 Tax=Candidatus Williamhamiltonella defendens TaxID=138072 RepID=UPI0020C5FE09|nr:TraY domain-containing protein [Candidatus Hamiltonella defensa]